MREVQARWIQQLPSEVRTKVKQQALATLDSTPQAGNSAAQLIASIAAIELPRGEWHELLPTLVHNVGNGTTLVKQSSLIAIGYMCESDDLDTREALTQHSNAILTAVVQGARKEEESNDVRYSALTALSDAVEFVRSNFDNEGERNYIMQVVCESTQSDDSRIQAAAFGCLNRIMGIYYDKMRFYMEKALFGLTIMGMKNEEEEVAKLAIEFWCTVCEEEISIEDDNAQLVADEMELRPFFQFARIAAREVLPVLLQLMTKVEEDDLEDEYNVPRAAYQCLQLYAQCVGGELVPIILQFVEANLRNEDWHYRDAAVSAFGAIMDGPDFKVLDPIVKQALPVLISMMEDQSVVVKDSAAYALSRICDFCSDSIDPDTHLQPLMSALFHGLMSNPKMASSCCLALMNLTERFISEDGSQTNAMTVHFQESVSSLLSVTERQQSDNTLRTAAYEVLSSFVGNSANDSLPIISQLSEVLIQRLEATIPMQQQVVSVDDKITLEELQTSLASVIMAIIQRLEKEIAPVSDHIMQVCLQILSSVPSSSSVPDTIFGVVGAMTNALEQDFLKYMEAFVPFLYNALANQEASGLCAMAIGLVSDIVRALQEQAQPYCDQFMNHLLTNLKSDKLNNQLKPSILETFGDIANAIGTKFNSYLSVVAQVLQQAATVTVAGDVQFDMLDYIVSLREGIVDAWGGIVLAFKDSAASVLQPYVEPIFLMLQMISQDNNRSEGLLRASMGLIG